jgi:hypothetical protein
VDARRRARGPLELRKKGSLRVALEPEPEPEPEPKPEPLVLSGPSTMAMMDELLQCKAAQCRADRGRVGQSRAATRQMLTETGVLFLLIRSGLEGCRGSSVAFH